MSLCVLNLLAEGPIPYTDAWERQKTLVRQRQENIIGDTLLLLSHPPTITWGKAADPACRLLTPDEYAARGIVMVPTDRGGDVTYHGPGQLVGYPILHLGENQRDLHRYVRLLEEIITSAASDLGVPGAHRAPWHAGVWVEDGYLAALGVKVSRWVTHHGFAINVDARVRDGFDTIVPCGVPEKRVTTLSDEAGRMVFMDEAASAVAYHFAARWPMR